MKINNIVEDETFPPPENARKTQIAGTLPTYVKAKQHLDTQMPTGKTLDFGAGLGGGAAHMGADSYEPFPRPGFEPTYKKVESIPSDTYSRVTNLNVLNVVPKGVRDMIVKNIGRVLAPGGTAIITTRGKDVMSAKGQEGPEAMSKITSIGTYQKGFTTKELMAYVQSILGDGFTVQPLKLGPAGVMVKKLGEHTANESIINELANQPYPYTLHNKTSYSLEYSFNTDTGSNIIVYIDFMHTGDIDISFVDSTSDTDGDIRMTGKGDAFRIFATVGDIVKKYVSKHNPPEITFSGDASEAGRIKLYDTISKNIGRYLPGYELSWKTKGDVGEKVYKFRRIQKKFGESVIDEVADQPYRFISLVSTATTQKSMFQTDSGTTIQVFIQVDTGNGVADIGFFDATDKENPTIGMTGKGDAFRVFATVGAIVKQFVAKRKPPYISFSGKSSDAGRIKLYDMIAKNIGHYLPEYKLIDSGFANGDKGYTFKRVMKENLDEIAKVRLSKDPNEFGAWVRDSGNPEKTTMIPISKLSGFEPDSKFDQPENSKNLDNIVKAIKAGKKLPPILVRRLGIDRFQVVDGHHRFKAYKMAGAKSIPARVVDPKNVTGDVEENFADGKGPGKPGDSQRHGIPKHATMSELEKASHADGRKGQLARWQMNMRRGKKHASENWTPMQLAVMEGGHLLDDLDEDYRDAARFAAQKHKGQTRSGGKPYIGHPVRVANIVKQFKNSKVLDQILSAAFLHDTIEDTDTPEEELRKMFGVLVASLVRELTSDKEEISRVGKTEYLATKMTNMSSWALVIKLADRLDNVSDIKHAKTPEWRHRYRLETETILNRIESDRVLSGTHKRLISLIRRKLQELDEPVAEGLSHNDPVEKWVATFKKSTHPKFRGKTPEQREKMARMAQYKAAQNKKIGEDVIDVDEALLGTQPSRKERYSRQVRGEKGAGGEVTKTQKAGIINQRHPFQGKLVGSGS